MVKFEYRPDVDGLRAIAVLAVVLYHLGFDTFSGGFVGVDVFFVISGYLITGIIKRKLAEKEFSLADFFLRRVRRLLPALIFTVACSFVAAFYLLPPPEMKDFGGSAIAALFSFSNIYFWSGSGYFDTAALSKPLLHAWSLSVEEQFYLFWPLFLIAICKFRHAAGGLILAAIGVVSLALSQYVVNESPSAAFFWMPFRVYEFSIGALLAWYGLGKSAPGMRQEFLLFTGLGLIGYSIFTFTEDTLFPGVSALIPCLGAALVIHGGGAKWLGSLIRNRAMVFLGLISYSFYLAHWPIIVFFQYYNVDAASTVQTLGLLAASLTAGYLMYRFVETPFRSARFRSKGLGAMAAAYSAVLALLFFPAAYAWSSNGWTWRLPEELRKSVEVMVEERSNYWRDAFANGGSFSGNGRKVYVIGNSYAVDIYNSLNALDGIDARIDRSTGHECFAMRIPISADISFDCEDNFNQVLNTQGARDADYIVFTEKWRIELGSDRYLRELQTTIEAVREINPQAKLVLVGPRQSFRDKPVYQRILDFGRLHNVDKYLSNFYAHPMPAVEQFDQDLNNFSASVGAEYISTIDLFCNEGLCRVTTPGDFMIYWDAGHWTNSGSEFFAERLVESGYADIFRD